MLIFLFGTSIASLWSPSSRVSELYWYYKNRVLRFVWYCLVFIQYTYYCDLFCSWPSSRLRNQHCHVWVQFIHTTKITVACMSLLIFSIDLRRICYFIDQCYNGEINNRTGHLFSHKYWICSFVLFLNTTFLQQTKQFIIFNILQLTTITATKFIS